MPTSKLVARHYRTDFWTEDPVFSPRFSMMTRMSVMYGTIVRSVVSALFFRRVGGTGRETPGHDEISIHTSAQISKSSPQHNCRSILTVPPASEIMVSLRDHLKNHFGFDEFRNRQEDVVQVLQQHIFFVFVVVLMFFVFCCCVAQSMMKVWSHYWGMVNFTVTLHIFYHVGCDGWARCFVHHGDRHREEYLLSAASTNHGNGCGSGFTADCTHARSGSGST